MSSIAVCVATRGSPTSLEMVLRVLKELESGRHDVRYIIGVDPDDIHTYTTIDNGFYSDNKVFVSMGDERPETLGEVWNRCAAWFDADIYFPIGDDALCLSQNWDEILVYGMRDFPVMSGMATYNPSEPIFPVVTKAWYKAARHLSIDLFPYWFTDTWTQELYEFVTGDKVPLLAGLVFGGKKGKTRNMRELEFWWGVFNATRTIRIREAKRIREELGLLEPNSFAVEERKQEALARDKSMLQIFERVEEGISTEKKETLPSEQYLRARSKAENLLRDRGLPLWCNLNGWVE